MSTEDPGCYDLGVSLSGALACTLLSLSLANVPLPGTSSVSVAFSPPSTCDVCHGLFDREGSAFGTWAGSAMAHAARDPIYRAALVVAERDTPGIGDFCLRCHVPEAWLVGRCFPTDGSRLLPEDGGVGCAFCHRSEPNPYVRNGQYVVAEDTTMRGPYADPALPDHPAARSPWISDARMCGTCHDLYNPLVDRKNLDGSLTGLPFPEQTTYSEWNQSAFRQEGQTCQECHMPESPGVVARERPERPDRSSHELSGGNAYLLSLIELLHPELNLGAELARGVARNLAMLRTAARLELSAPPQLVCGETTEIGIRVINETGHKLPTGYPDGRRVVLGARSAELGLERGLLDGTSGEAIDPLALYEVRQGQLGVGPGHHLAKNDVIYFDNRIPPRGFVPTSTTAPVGVTYPEASPGVLVHYDDVMLSLEVPCEFAGRTVDLEVFLRYQSATRRSLDALITDTDDHPAGEWLAAGVSLFPPRAYEMASLTLSLPVSTAPALDAGLAADLGAARDTGVTLRPDAAASDAAGPMVEPLGPEEDGCGCLAAGAAGRASAPMLQVLFLLLFAFRRRILR